MKNVVFIFFLICLGYIGYAQSDSPVKVRNYCTEIGRFDLTFYENEVSGIYVLIHKKQIGAIWGSLIDNEMKGRWIDKDGAGEIIITFNSDYSSFRADYRSDDEPEKWYLDSWHGVLRISDNPSFKHDGKTYKCE